MSWSLSFYQELDFTGVYWVAVSVKTQTLETKPYPLDMVKRVACLSIVQHVYTNHAPYLQHYCEKVVLWHNVNKNVFRYLLQLKMQHSCQHTKHIVNWEGSYHNGIKVLCILDNLFWPNVSVIITKAKVKKQHHALFIVIHNYIGGRLCMAIDTSEDDLKH